MGKASEGAKRPSGGSFCTFEIEIERSGAHFGRNLWEIFNKKVRRKYIFMENVCFLH